MKQFRVYILDVWGNPKDGFEVNDRSGCGTIDLPDNYSDQDLIQALLDADILASFSGTIKEKFEIDGDDTWLSIDSKKDMRPLLQLELV